MKFTMNIKFVYMLPWIGLASLCCVVECACISKCMLLSHRKSSWRLMRCIRNNAWMKWMNKIKRNKKNLNYFRLFFPFYSSEKLNNINNHKKSINNVMLALRSALVAASIAHAHTAHPAHSPTLLRFSHFSWCVHLFFSIWHQGLQF